VIILSIVGGALLLALLIMLILLFTRDSTPSPGPTPTSSASTPTPTPTATETSTVVPTPTVTPTETSAPPPPPSTDASVDSFTINPTSVDCSSGDPTITIQWSTSNANEVFFGVDTADASTGPFFGDSLPASGISTNDFPDGYRPFTYTCGNGSHTYVITAVDVDGNKDTRSITVSG
jgi:hypothetical protein